MYKVRRKLSNLASRCRAGFGKTVAVLIIIAMAFADYLTMYNLFAALGVSDLLFGKQNPLINEIMVYSFTLSVLLEGIPFFVGYCGSILADKTIYRVNDKTNARIGMIVGTISSVMTFSLIIALRTFLIVQGDEDAGTPQLHLTLMITPILTSMLSFLASWTAFRSDRVDLLERRLAKQYKKCMLLQSEFLDVAHKNEDARTALWSSLTVNDKIPETLETFRKECFDRIRSKLIENTILEFPDQVERYNKAITGLLQEFAAEMSARSTDIPRDLHSMDVKDNIRTFDEEVKDTNPGEAWDDRMSGSVLEQQLKDRLDNAVVVAQFKTMVKPYYLEGDL